MWSFPSRDPQAAAGSPWGGTLKFVNLYRGRVGKYLTKGHLKALRARFTPFDEVIDMEIIPLVAGSPGLSRFPNLTLDLPPPHHPPSLHDRIQIVPCPSVDKMT